MYFNSGLERSKKIKMDSDNAMFIAQLKGQAFAVILLLGYIFFYKNKLTTKKKQ